jgi:hypothetical protein
MTLEVAKYSAHQQQAGMLRDMSSLFPQLWHSWLSLN